MPDFDHLHKECFESVHVHPYCGHYGNKRTLAKAKTIYFWPIYFWPIYNMARDIEHWCATCDSSQWAPQRARVGEVRHITLLSRHRIERSKAE